MITKHDFILCGIYFCEKYAIPATSATRQSFSAWSEKSAAFSLNRFAFSADSEDNNYLQNVFGSYEINKNKAN